MYIFNMLSISGQKFQTDYLKTLGGVDYTNLLPNIEAEPETCNPILKPNLKIV